MTFTEADKIVLQKKGISEDKVKEQIETFKAGIPFVNLHKAAVIDDGLQKFSDSEQKTLIAFFESKRVGLSLLKFVPASGAASRMFKALFNFIKSFNPDTQTFTAYIATTNDNSMRSFFENLEVFPFYGLVQERIAGTFETEDQAKHLFALEMLSEDALNYGFYPKGLLPFHKYEAHMATAFEEHLKEAALYAETNGIAKLHFTISPQHAKMFDDQFKVARQRVRAETAIDFEVSYSFQKPSTDTVAVDLNNEPFRLKDGTVLFRPGGHGALIENLNEQEADIIFIKNIDNVVPSKALAVIADSKKVLGGLLLQVQEKAFEFTRQLYNISCSSEKRVEAKQFLQEELNVHFSDDFHLLNEADQRLQLLSKLEGPIRICGMVRNEGEPGGGPFWVKNAKGEVSLQIIESAQINTENESQANIVQKATHFNPVDIVCGLRNYKGEKYNLLEFVDAKQGFITNKTKEGLELKAMELPGLWNGAKLIC